MPETPVTGDVAEYRGKRFSIVFSGDDWVALHAEPETPIPDGFERGEGQAGQGKYEPWVKVPRSAVDAIFRLSVSGELAGHRVSLRGRMPDGRIRVWFIGSPAVARELGLKGDQYMGWSGLFAPDNFQDIRVEETRRD